MRPRVGFGIFLVGGVLVAAVLAFLISPEASSKPDGLEKVAIDEGFIDSARDHDLADSPTADYGVEGVDDERLSTGLAGLIGLAITGAVAAGVMLAVRRVSSRDRPAQVADAGPASPVTSPV